MFLFLLPSLDEVPLAQPFRRPWAERIRALALQSGQTGRLAHEVIVTRNHALSENTKKWEMRNVNLCRLQDFPSVCASVFVCVRSTSHLCWVQRSKKETKATQRSLEVQKKKSGTFRSATRASQPEKTFGFNAWWFYFEIAMLLQASWAAYRV